MNPNTGKNLINLDVSSGEFDYPEKCQSKGALSSPSPADDADLLFWFDVSVQVSKYQIKTVAISR